MLASYMGTKVPRTCLNLYFCMELKMASLSDIVHQVWVLIEDRYLQSKQ